MEKHVGTELTTEGARSTQKPKDNGTGIKKMLAPYEIIAGTVWPHLRAKVSRRRLKKATPAGATKEAPGVKFDPPGVQFRVLGSPKRASGDLRQVSLRGALWARKGQLEN